MNGFTDLYAYLVTGDDGVGRLWIGGVSLVTGRVNGMLAMVTSPEGYDRLTEGYDVHLLPSTAPFFG